jgi:uncharacterized protein YecE (DUF72 family)
MVYIGTSGFKYPEWKGKFYPEKIKPAEMFPYYAARFNTTEINYTFYRMPTTRLLQGWQTEVPKDFVFSFKAPRRITHDAQLKNSGSLTDDFLEICKTLNQQLAVALFQLPPTFQKDLPVLDEFLRGLPPLARVAFEFRHPSWFSDDVYASLHEKNAALCIADSEKLSTPVQLTADFAYFRLRNEGYQPKDIERWGKEISRCQGDVFVYFKHEDRATGPDFAQRLKALLR